MLDSTVFLRYPGSKRRMLRYLATHLPTRGEIQGRLVEPFVGGGAIYFYLQPKRALVADLNPELMDIYRGVRQSPKRVWQIYRTFPATKRGYKAVRDADVSQLTLLQRAARSLFLSRTCFKGMWRHNKEGKFNVGYGGQARRWSVSRQHLVSVAELLAPAYLRCCDFEPVISETMPGDFIFADPPYRPGEREQVHDHYSAQQFRFSDQQRLASALRSADKRGVEWLLTTSSHPDIARLYRGFSKFHIDKGTGRKIGSRSNDSGEVLITNSPRALR